jgi:hypothetical protein
MHITLVVKAKFKASHDAVRNGCGDWNVPARDCAPRRRLRFGPVGGSVGLRGAREGAWQRNLQTQLSPLRLRGWRSNFVGSCGSTSGTSRVKKLAPTQPFLGWGQKLVFTWGIRGKSAELI